MGLDSRDHTKSGPSGTGFFLHDVIRHRDRKQNLTRRPNHRHDRIIAANPHERMR
jgi:hypothetical protein